MVNPASNLGHRARQRAECGALMTELTVAMAIMMIAFLPLAYSFLQDGRVFRAAYQRALMMEIVDGEMEVLAAGEWRDFPEGTQTYTLRLDAAAQLPPGQLQFTRSGRRLRLEWRPSQRSGIGTVVREATLK